MVRLTVPSSKERVLMKSVVKALSVERIIT